MAASGHSLKYQWKKNNADITGGMNSSFSIPAIAAGDAGNYSVVLTDTCGTLTSSNASLTILPPDSCVTAVSPIDNPVAEALLMPNLVRDNTTLKIIARNSVRMNWVVIDMNGKVVMKFSNQPVYGENYYQLSFQHLASGIYFIRGTSANRLLQCLKFVKY